MIQRKISALLLLLVVPLIVAADSHEATDENNGPPSLSMSSHTVKGRSSSSSGKGSSSFRSGKRRSSSNSEMGDFSSTSRHGKGRSSSSKKKKTSRQGKRGSSSSKKKKMSDETEEMMWEDLMEEKEEMSMMLLTPSPTEAPSISPTGFPSYQPSSIPSVIPTASPSTSPTETPTLMNLIESRGELMGFALGVIASGIDRFFVSGLGYYTVFAPTNSAFDELDMNLASLLLYDAHYGLHLYDLIAYHVSMDEYFSGDLVDLANSNSSLSTLKDMELLTFSIGDNGLSILSSAPTVALVTQADLDASDGVLHIISKVLWPEFFTFNPLSFLKEFNIWNRFQEFIVASGVDSFLATARDISLIAPNDSGVDDEAYQYLLDPSNADELLHVVNYHILEQVFNFQLLQVPSETLAFKTRQGEDMEISRTLDGLFFDGRLSRQYGLTERGVVYEVGLLLQPESLNIPGPTRTITVKAAIGKTSTTEEEKTGYPTILKTGQQRTENES